MDTWRSEGCPGLTVPCVPWYSLPGMGQQLCGCCPLKLWGESGYCNLQIHSRPGPVQIDLEIYIEGSVSCICFNIK